MRCLASAIRRSALFLLLVQAAASASGQAVLTTTFASDTGGAAGGAVYFDLEVEHATLLHALDCNFLETAGTPVGLEIWVTLDTYVGKGHDQSLWRLIAGDDGTSLTAGPNEPTRITLARPQKLVPGRYGVALIAVGAGHRYTTGIGSNEVYANAFLRIETGAADNIPFTGARFNERVWNGRLLFGPKNMKGPFLYAYDEVAEGIHAFWLEKRTGTPAEILGSPFPVTGGSTGGEVSCKALAADPQGEFLFAATNLGLSVQRRSPSGVLEEVLGSPFAGNNTLTGLSAWRKGKQLRVYATVSRNGAVDAFDIDATTGRATLLPGSPQLGRAGAIGIVATKKFVYVTHERFGRLHAFRIDETSGALTEIAGSPFSFAGLDRPFDLVADAKGTMLATNDCGDGEYAFIRLDALTGAPLDHSITGGGALCAGLFGFDKSGKSFFGASDTNLDVLERGGPILGSARIPAVSALEAGVVSSRGNWVYAADRTALFQVPIDTVTKTPIAERRVRLGSTFANEPRGIVLLER